jgi:hypothetical protein
MTNGRAAALYGAFCVFICRVLSVVGLPGPVSLSGVIMRQRWRKGNNYFRTAS